MTQFKNKPFEAIDLTVYLKILLRYWYVAVLAISICLTVAYFKLKYSISLYSVKTVIQIKDKSTHSYGSQNFLQGMSLFTSFKNVANELQIIRSFDVIQTAVKEIDKPFTYYHVGDINDYEYYDDAPIKLVIKEGAMFSRTPIYIATLNDSTFKLTIHTGKYKPYDYNRNVYIDTLLPAINFHEKVFVFGEIIKLPLLEFSINKSNPASQFTAGNLFYIVPLDLEDRTYAAKAKIGVGTANEEAPIVSISSSGPVKQREVDIVNKVAEVYIRKELEEKNQIASNTINFIDNQLMQITDSLNNTENSLQRFKTKNKMFDVQDAAKNTYNDMITLDKARSELELQNKYYLYLKDYVNSDRPFNDVMAPTTVNISDPLLNKLVGELVGLYSERNTLKYTSSERSPAYQTILLQIRSSKEALLENVDNIYKSSKIALMDIDERIKLNEMKFSSLPAQERNLLNIQRRFDLNNSIYNYLLQKRSEASIAKASNLPDAKVIEIAKVREAGRVFPNPNNIYAVSIFTALLTIVVFIVVVSLLQNKIKSKEDVQSHTNVPFLGSIQFLSNMPLHLKEVYQLEQGVLESFRSIRVNLNYYIKGKPSAIIGITSSISGDGKSFTSYNLAKIFALSEKKTLLISADMRKAVQTSAYGFDEVKSGLSNYLIKGATLAEVIKQTEDPHLSVIFPGNIPPNASELIASNRMKELLKEVSGAYDIIIVDSPPIGLVSDYLSLIDLVDINLYVVRIDHTPKKVLSIIQEVTENYPQAQHALLLNGVRAGGSYGYGYGYAYGYGYGQAAPKKNLLQRLLSKKTEA